MRTHAELTRVHEFPPRFAGYLGEAVGVRPAALEPLLELVGGHLAAIPQVAQEYVMA